MVIYHRIRKTKCLPNKYLTFSKILGCVYGSSIFDYLSVYLIKVLTPVKIQQLICNNNGLS